MKLVEKEGRKKSCSFFLLFVKAKYSLDSNLWLTPSFTRSLATTTRTTLQNLLQNLLSGSLDSTQSPKVPAMSQWHLPSQFHEKLQASGILGALFGQQPLAHSQLTDYTELGASLWLFNRLMASCHRQGTLLPISSVLHDFISILSPKRKPRESFWMMNTIYD